MEPVTVPLKTKPAQEKPKTGLNMEIRFPLGDLDKAFIAKQLGVMMAGGLTLPEALQALKDQSTKKNLRNLISDILDSTIQGNSLQSSLEKHKTEFGQLFTQVVGAGESGGTLEQNLAFLASHFRRQDELKKKIQGAMTYPIIVLGMLLALVVAAVVFIFPAFKSLFSAFGNMQLPLMTRIFLDVSDWAGANGLYLLIGIVGFIVLFVILNRIPSVKIVLDHYAIRLPGFGKIIWYSGLSQFSYVLGALLSGGVPITAALHVTAESVGSKYLRKIALEAEQYVQKGSPLGEALKAHSAELTPFMISMIETGEKSGKMEENITYVGEYYSEELAHQAELLPAFIGPAMLIGVGVMVAMFALAVIMPIYQATSFVQAQ